MLEQKEKERVMKLMDRLENMKRNASHSANGSTNKCALCGDFFYSLRSLPSQCNMCKKILCAKCCIDTAVNDDTSGGNSVETSRSVIYLCRLCSEQREFLKKSGVWFLRRLPDYMQATREKFSSTSSISTMSEQQSQSSSNFDSPSTNITAKSSGISSNSNNNNSSSKHNGSEHVSSGSSPSHTSKSFSFVTPLFMRQNVSASSSPSYNSSALRFWKTSTTFFSSIYAVCMFFIIRKFDLN